jgi:hypothetical protein
MFDRHPFGFSTITLIPMALFVLLLAAGVQADTIIAASANDAALRDVDGDDRGDNLFVRGGMIAVGESNNTADEMEMRFWLPFELTAKQRTAIAAGLRVDLDLTLREVKNAAGFTVDLYGLADRVVSAASAGDYEAPAVLLVREALNPGSAPGRYHFDVTDFVKAEAAKAGSVIVFRLQANPASLPNDNKVIDNFVFAAQERDTAAQRPTLTVSTTAAARSTNVHAE